MTPVRPGPGVGESMASFHRVSYDLVLKDLILQGVMRPDRQGAGATRVRIDPMAVRGLDLLVLHGPVPSTHKVGAFIIKANPLKGSSPGGIRRCAPFPHGPLTVGALR